MSRRLFLYLSATLLSLSCAFADGVACLNSSIADLWTLAGGDVSITVQDSIDRGFCDEDAILVDGASGRSINLEILVASQPQLVLASADTPSHVRVKALMDDLGIPTLLIRQDSFDDFLSVFRILTRITGREDLWLEHGPAQKEVVDETIRACQANRERPRVLFIRAGSAFSAVRAKRAEDHFAAAIIEDLGGVNVAAEAEALTESISLEAVLAMQPDRIIIVAQGDEEASRRYISSLFSRPGWNSVKAVRDGQVRFLSKELFNYKPNGRWGEAYQVMAEALYE